jgi:hypothetical protein
MRQPMSDSVLISLVSVLPSMIAALTGLAVAVHSWGVVAASRRGRSRSTARHFLENSPEASGVRVDWD